MHTPDLVPVPAPATTAFRLAPNIRPSRYPSPFPICHRNSPIRNQVLRATPTCNSTNSTDVLPDFLQLYSPICTSLKERCTILMHIPEPAEQENIINAIHALPPMDSFITSVLVHFLSTENLDQANELIHQYMQYMDSLQAIQTIIGSL